MGMKMDLEMLDLDEYTEILRRRRDKYWEEIDKSDGFDVPRGLCPEGFHGLAVKRCDDQFPCSPLVMLYAKMGLHRYNLLKGTKYQLHRVKRYNHNVCCCLLLLHYSGCTESIDL